MADPMLVLAAWFGGFAGAFAGVHVTSMANERRQQREPAAAASLAVPWRERMGKIWGFDADEIERLDRSS